MHVPDVLLDIAGGIALTLLISFIFKKILPRLAKKTRSDFDDFLLREISGLILPFGIIAVLLLAEAKLQLPGGLNRPYEIILTIVGAVVVIRLINRIGMRLLQHMTRASHPLAPEARSSEQLPESCFTSSSCDT